MRAARSACAAPNQGHDEPPPFSISQDAGTRLVSSLLEPVNVPYCPTAGMDGRFASALTSSRVPTSPPPHAQAHVSWYAERSGSSGECVSSRIISQPLPRTRARFPSYATRYENATRAEGWCDTIAAKSAWKMASRSC